MSAAQLADGAMEKVVRRSATNPDRLIRRRVTYDVGLIGRDEAKSLAAPPMGRTLSRRNTLSKGSIVGLVDQDTRSSTEKTTGSAWLPGQHSAMRSDARRLAEELQKKLADADAKGKSRSASKSSTRSSSRRDRFASNGSAGAGGDRDLSPELAQQTMARRIRRRVELEQEAVVRILAIFEEESAAGPLKIGSFRSAVRKIAAHRDLNENGIQQAWKLAGMKEESANTLGGVDMFEFCQWWAMEEKWADIKAAAAWQATPEAMQELADSRGVDIPMLEKVKSIYDDFDDNGTGIMDFIEFGEALRDLFKLDKAPGEDFTRKQWAVLDQDDSGEVDFPEFARWYLVTFDSDTGDVKAARKCTETPEVAIPC